MGGKVDGPTSLRFDWRALGNRGSKERSNVKNSRSTGAAECNGSRMFRAQPNERQWLQETFPAEETGGTSRKPQNGVTMSLSQIAAVIADAAEVSLKTARQWVEETLSGEQSFAE